MNYNIRFDFAKHHNIFFAISAVIIIVGVVVLSTMGLNYGVDFKAGTLLDVSFGQTVDQDEVNELLQQAGVETPSDITVGTGDDARMSIRFDEVLEPEEVIKVNQLFIDKFGDQVSYEENTVDPELALELARKALYAIAFASLGIMLYVSIRFEWRFALGGIIALLHDALMVVSLFSIFRLEVNLPFVAAILTILGFSINDTIVIFDRIRENLQYAKLKSFADLMGLVNRSIWQTMTRSINTMLTVLFATVCLFVFGSESIRLFSLAMLFGLICGTYSSIFIASQIWMVLKKNAKSKKIVASK